MWKVPFSILRERKTLLPIFLSNRVVVLDGFIYAFYLPVLSVFLVFIFYSGDNGELLLFQRIFFLSSLHREFGGFRRTWVYREQQNFAILFTGMDYLDTRGGDSPGLCARIKPICRLVVSTVSRGDLYFSSTFL